MNTFIVRKAGFSLVELVIVVVITGIVAAIAVRRMSQGSSGAACSALRADLSALRKAIEMYAAQHGGTYPEEGGFKDQLTKYTDLNGDDKKERVAPYVFGPYLQSIPYLPVGEGSQNGKGKNKVASSPSSDKGWIYDEDTGLISANSGTAADESGTLFSDY